MPESVEELIKKRQVNEFYEMPIEEKVVIFLKKHRDEAYTVIELIKELEKGFCYQPGDRISEVVAVLTGMTYLRALDYLVNRGILDSYTDDSKRFYFIKR